MSLDFDFSNIKDFRNVVHHPHPKRDALHPITNFMIWTLMVIGVRAITKDNVDKVHERMSLYQRVTGPAVRFRDDTSYYATREDIERHIGLSTNVTAKTDAEFMKSVRNWHRNYTVTPRDNPDAVPGWDGVTAKIEAGLIALCERRGVRLVQAQEEEIKGMWDWLDDHGNACDQSFDTKARAAADAVEKLDLSDDDTDDEADEEADENVELRLPKELAEQVKELPPMVLATALQKFLKERDLQSWLGGGA